MSITAHIESESRFVDHPFVARLLHWSTFNEGEVTALERIIEAERIIKRRHELVVAGDTYRSLCFVKSGYAIRYKLLRNGKRQILNVILPGDIVGFPVSFFDRSMYSIVAVSDLTYNVCALDSYVGLCFEKPQFGLVLGWIAAYEAAIYAEHIVDLGRRTPVERLAHFLLEMHTRLLNVGPAEATSFNLPFSQEVMADVLGLSVPHLNRVMQQLRADGLIASQARLVQLTDIERLQTLAQYQPLALAPIRNSQARP